MVPAIRSKLALIGALALALVVAVSVSLGAHRADSLSGALLHTRTAELKTALDIAINATRGEQHLDSLRAIAQDSLRVEHDKRLAAEASAAKIRSDFIERARVAPDTCGPVISAALDAIESVTAADSALKLELQADQHDKAIVVAQRDSAREALGKLIVAAHNEIVAATPTTGHRALSLLSRLTPKLGVGAAVGIDPMTNRPAKAVGVTLGWSF